jgi:hypothetical protein
VCPLLCEAGIVLAFVFFLNVKETGNKEAGYLSKSKEKELQDAMKIGFYISHSVRHNIYYISFSSEKIAQCGNMSKI